MSCMSLDFNVMVVKELFFKDFAVDGDKISSCLVFVRSSFCLLSFYRQEKEQGVKDFSIHGGGSILFSRAICRSIVTSLR